MKPFILCDNDCVYCPYTDRDLGAMVSFVFNLLLDKFGDDVYKIVSEHCYYLTKCPYCGRTDFNHAKNCRLNKSLKKYKQDGILP